MKLRRLIINGDDFGLHESINAGIIAAHRSGCLTSASIMAGGAAFDDAVCLARRYPSLGIGVHLTLVAARPVAHGDIHTILTQDGRFFSGYGAFVKRYLAGKIDKKHIERELSCQIQKVVGAGVKISHIDSHQHLHVLPGMPGVIARIAADFGVNKIRIPAEPIGYLGTGGWTVGRWLGKTALTVCATMARCQYATRGFAFTEHFRGMMAGGSMNREEMIHILKHLPDGVTEIMVHPGADNAVLGQVFPWQYHWQDEMETLMHDEVLTMIRNGGIQLIDYRAIEPQHK